MEQITLGRYCERTYTEYGGEQLTQPGSKCCVAQVVFLNSCCTKHFK